MARITLDELRAARPQVDRAKIDATSEADIRAHAVEDGHDPDAEIEGYTLVPAPAEIRRKLGASQVAFAEALGVPVSTYRNWEQGRKVPDPAARSLLTIFDKEPEAAMRALSNGRIVAVRVTKEGRPSVQLRNVAVPNAADVEGGGNPGAKKSGAQMISARGTPRSTGRPAKA